MAIQRRFLLLTVLLFAVSGCALTNVKLKAPESGLEAPIPKGKQQQIVLVVPFKDERANKTRCGVQKNGYGNETASTICEGDPTEWIASFLTRELTASGFTILRSEDGAK